MKESEKSKQRAFDNVMSTDTAYLSNEKDMIIFQYENKIIRFRGPYSLERFTEVKKWDNGYLVIMAKYRHNEEAEEEYIDLIPILRNLYIDVLQFLAPIKEVKLGYKVELEKVRIM